MESTWWWWRSERWRWSSSSRRRRRRPLSVGSFMHISSSSWRPTWTYSNRMPLPSKSQFPPFQEFASVEQTEHKLKTSSSPSQPSPRHDMLCEHHLLLLLLYSHTHWQDCLCSVFKQRLTTQVVLATLGGMFMHFDGGVFFLKKVCSESVPTSLYISHQLYEAAVDQRSFPGENLYFDCRLYYGWCVMSIIFFTNSTIYRMEIEIVF